MNRDAIIPLEDYPRLVEEALEVLRTTKSHATRENPYPIDRETWKNDDARHFIEKASYEALPVLHTHLDELFFLFFGTTAEKYYPWRESGLLHYDFLTRIIRDTTQEEAVRTVATSRLLETRHPQALSFAEHESGESDREYFERELRWIGYHKQDGLYLPLYPADPLYIIFQKDYLTQIDASAASFGTRHPTWHLPAASEQAHQFGGKVDNVCTICGGLLDHVITLKPISARLGINNLSSVTLAFCNSCLLWNWNAARYLYYEHDLSGYPRSIGYAGSHVEPHRRETPLIETPARLAESGSQWRWQPHEVEQNLHRLGGHPTWIQGDEYPPCIHCQQPMHFIMQLSEGLPAQSNNHWFWGDSAMCFGFWCDTCHISAYLIQSY